MSAVITESLTAEQLFEMPYDGFRYELIQGELRKMSPAGGEHGWVGMELAGPLHHYVKKNKLGKVFLAETGFLLTVNPDTVIAPDVAFISQKRVRQIRKKSGYWEGAPDLVVEVISPGDTYSEVDEKVAMWLSAGASLVWILNPRLKTVTAYRSLDDVVILTEKDTLDGDDVVSGFQISVEEIFSLE